MNVEIRKLTPALLDDYLCFFETAAHEDNPGEDRCYCVCWCSADHREKPDFSTPERRRTLAVQYVNSGVIQGYLAYANDQVVGWCNANTRAACLNCISWLRLRNSVGKRSARFDSNQKVKSVYCFAIAPGMKRKGIATQLLERVCRDAADDGFDLVEAYPNKKFDNEFQDFPGPRNLYQKCGFTVYKKIKHTVIMQKQLKESHT